MDSLLQDLKFALRMLRKSPSVTAVAVLTLAIAIGATTSIFSAVSAMLLRPLPFPKGEALVQLEDLEPQTEPHGFSWPEFTDLRSQGPDLAAFSAYRQETANARHLARMRALHESISGPARPLLLLLLGAVGLVLLIAAVNLASVVLSRATGRVREFAVRRALGATAGRLARQLLVENAVI